MLKNMFLSLSLFLLYFTIDTKKDDNFFCRTRRMPSYRILSNICHDVIITNMVIEARTLTTCANVTLLSGANTTQIIIINDRKATWVLLQNTSFLKSLELCGVWNNLCLVI